MQHCCPPAKSYMRSSRDQFDIANALCLLRRNHRWTGLRRIFLELLSAASTSPSLSAVSARRLPRSPDAACSRQAACCCPFAPIPAVPAVCWLSAQRSGWGAGTAGEWVVVARDRHGRQGGQGARHQEGAGGQGKGRLIFLYSQHRPGRLLLHLQRDVHLVGGAGHRLGLEPASAGCARRPLLSAGEVTAYNSCKSW
jgi:hypothetical protein